MWRDPQLGQVAVIGAARLRGIDLAVRDRPQVADEGQLVLAVVDLAPEERRPRPVPAGVLEQEERVVGGAGGATEDARHEVRVVGDQFLHHLRPVVGDLQEDRPPRLRDARERADDHVVDEAADVLRPLRTRDVRLEHLEEVPEALALGLEPEVLVGLERGDVERDVVVQRDRVEPQLGAALELAAVRVGEAAHDLLERRRAEGPRGRLRVGLAGDHVDVGRVVGADGRCDRRLPSNSRSWIVRTSLVLALMSMMSTSPWRTISRIWSR